MQRGKVLRVASLIFDNFSLREHGFTYFLSHTHADHLHGLCDGWDRGKIYCSHETKFILLQKWPSLRPYVEAREVGESFIVPLDANGVVSVEARMLDANHCLGSVMFVVDGFFGRIVFTGDFRLSEELLAHPIWEEETPVDVLFVDNTLHASPIPQGSLTEIRKMMCEVAALYPSHSKFYVGIESLGKEDAVAALAKRLNTKAFVSRERFELIKRISDLDSNVFVWEEGRRKEARVIVVPRSAICEKNVNAWNADPDEMAIGMLLAASAVFGRKQVEFLGKFAPGTLAPDDARALVSMFKKYGFKEIENRRFFLVPYTLHAPRDEMEAMVRLVRPFKLVGLVPEETKGKMRHHITRWVQDAPIAHMNEIAEATEAYEKLMAEQAQSRSASKRERERELKAAKGFAKMLKSIPSLRKPPSKFPEPPLLQVKTERIEDENLPSGSNLESNEEENEQENMWTKQQDICVYAIAKLRPDLREGDERMYKQLCAAAGITHEQAQIRHEELIERDRARREVATAKRKNKRTKRVRRK